jgi:hypothetical protein
VSTLPPSPAPDDPLARAEAAFLRMPVPEGPSPKVVAQTLAALSAKTVHDNTHLMRRRIMFATLKKEMTIWIDPGTRLPVRFESSDRIQGKDFWTTASDFQIDPKIDDALFSTDPPPGYAIRKGASDTLAMDDKTFLNPEKAAEGLLREFAKKSGGAFPKKLDDLDEFSKMFPKKEKPGTLPAPETLQAVQSLTRFLMASKNMKGGFGYKSDGVKLGDADKILFWYRPEGATQYRALYGDLHAADVTDGKLPEKPKP